MTSQHLDTAVLIFCKAPVPGQVKTRLIPFLTAEQAADLHSRMSQRILRVLDQQSVYSIQLWCSPSIEHPFFKDCAKNFRLTLHHQQGIDLGERMNNALNSALNNYERVLLIGCDCPSLTISDFDDAVNALKQNNDIVLGPAEDGGYVLIGVKRPLPELFTRMYWGTSDVLATTRKRIEELKLDCYELQEQWDVDTPEDYDRLPEAFYTL